MISTRQNPTPRPSSAFLTVDPERAGKQTGFLMIPHSPDDDAWGATRVPIAIIRGQWDAGHALGLGVGRIVRRIILPQAIPIMVPSFMTNAIIIVKATAIASLIGVSELTGASMGAMSITYSALDFLMIAAALYLIISAVLATLQAIIEFALERRLTARPRA